MNKIKSVLKMMRIHQYLKNLFIFMPIFFSENFLNKDMLLKTILMFIFFSMAASSIYILNDIVDINDDKLHPVKSQRPIASGVIKIKEAVAVMILLFATAIAGSMYVNLSSCIIVCFYIVLNVLYSIKLKHISIVDISIISTGFVIRLLVGSSATGVELSHWIVIMTFLLALFIALAKRRDDMIIYLEQGLKLRKSIDGYNLEFLNAAIVAMSPVVIVTYIMYTVSDEVVKHFHNKNLYLTVFFVIVGILRYMQITFVEKKSGSPTEILIKDTFIKIILLCWIVTFFIFIYILNRR